VGKTGVRSGMRRAACHKIERLVCVAPAEQHITQRERENAACRRSIKRKVDQRRQQEEYHLHMQTDAGHTQRSNWPAASAQGTRTSQPPQLPQLASENFMRDLCACFRHGGSACWPLTNYQVTHRSSRSTSASATPILLLLAQPRQQGEHNHKGDKKIIDVRLI
jgi:hypothetical protein